MNLIMTGKAKSDQVIGFGIGWVPVDVMHAEPRSASAKTAFPAITKDGGFSATIAESLVVFPSPCLCAAGFTFGKGGSCDGTTLPAETRIAFGLTTSRSICRRCLSTRFTSSKALGCQLFTRAADAFRDFVMRPIAAQFQAGRTSRFVRTGGGFSTINTSSAELVLFIKTFFLQKFRCWRFSHNVTSSDTITHFASIVNL